MPILIDTDVLIDYLRNREEAVLFLESSNELMLLSVITIAELYAGTREGSERETLDEFIRAFETVHVGEEIAVTGGLYRREYGKSHGIGLADALIAASAEATNARVVTLNKRHFPMFEDVFVPYQKN